jgi:biopolymer transport protein ExbB
MKKLPRLLFCLALLILAGSALANPYGYAYFRTVTIDHTKVGVAGYAAYRSVTVDHTKVQGSSSYAYYRAITIDHTKVGTVNNTDQTAFPVLISGTFNGSGGTFDVRTAANGGPIQNTTTLNGQTVPADLIFTSDAACTTKLNWDIVNYNASSGVIEVWVQVPTVSHTSDTVIYACCDNFSISTYQGSAASAWDANYQGVWHMADNAASTTIVDSTGLHNGTLTGTGSNNTSSNTIAGNISTVSALHFDLNHNATMGSTYSYTNNFTVETWMYINGTPCSDCGFYTNGAGAGGGFNLEWHNGAAGITSYSQAYNYESTNDTTVNSWRHYVLTCTSGNACALYINGTSVKTWSGPASAAAGTFTLNSFYTDHTSVSGGGYQSNIYLDEFRISNTSRSADWIRTSYNNQSSPSTFTTIGSQTTPSLTNFPVLVADTYSYLATAANSGQIQNTVTLNGQTVPADLIFTSDAGCTTNL